MKEQTKPCEVEISILLAIANAEKWPTVNQLAALLSLNANAERQKLKYYLDKLEADDYIQISVTWGGNANNNAYGLTNKGRTYLVENSLI